MTEFGAIITAMITPFNADGAVDYAVTERLADYLVSNGSDALVVCGTTGESPTLTWEEEYQLFRVVKQTVSGRAKVIAGTGSNSTNEAIAATQKAEKVGVDGSLQVVPYYNKPPQEGLYQHFKAIAQACPDLPLMLYNVPGRTGRNLEAATIIELAVIPNVVAVKEASGNLEQSMIIRKNTSESFSIYSGDDALTLPMLSVGACGVVSVASHLVGNAMREMISAFTDGKVMHAEEIHLKLLPLFKILFATTNPIPVKSALSIQGWPVNNLRLPLVQASHELMLSLKETMQGLGLLESAVA